MVPITPRSLHILLFIAVIALFISAPVTAFTAKSLDITVDKSGDAIAIFRFSLEGFIENAIPQSTLENELMKGFGTSSEPPELIAMDRSSATIRMKQFVELVDVPSGTEYRTVSMDFKKAEIALQSSALSSVVSADFSPETITITFPDSYKREFSDTATLPSLTHIVIDPLKKDPAVVPTPPTGGAIKIVSSPEGTVVEIDGAYAGTAPATFTDMPAGTHRLKFSKENYEPVSKEVTVSAGQTIQVTVFLSYIQPTPTQAPGFAGVLAGIALMLCAILWVRQ